MQHLSKSIHNKTPKSHRLLVSMNDTAKENKLVPIEGRCADKDKPIIRIFNSAGNSSSGIHFDAVTPFIP